MADERHGLAAENEEPEEWEQVASDYERGDAQKSGPYVTISKGGALRATVEATRMSEEAASARGLARHEWVLQLRVNRQRGQVGCIPIPAEKAERGSVAVRWYEGKGSPRISFHIGGALKEHPSLQLKSKVRCHIAAATAPDGLPMLVIPLKAKLETQTTPRNDGSPGSQSAAGSDPK